MQEIHYQQGRLCEQMKLKTLKDLKDHWHSKSGMYHVGGVVSKEDLKQEAIKWVKVANSHWNEELDMDDWKEFFNITEEELK